MYKEENNYYYVEEFAKNNIWALFTKENAGDFSDNALNNLDENQIKKFLEKFTDTTNIVYATQTHSTNIKIVDENSKIGRYEDIDGFITKRKDMVLITKYADCLPIFIMDKNSELIAVLHSGWRGTCDGILSKAIEKIKLQFQVSKKDLVIALGIGIKKCCYEVGEDLYEKFSQKYKPELLENVFDRREDKLYFDNEILNYNILKNMGIEESNIIRSNVCTFCSDKFYSYRKNKINKGRNAGIILFKG